MPASKQRQQQQFGRPARSDGGDVRPFRVLLLRNARPRPLMTAERNRSPQQHPTAASAPGFVSLYLSAADVSAYYWTAEEAPLEGTRVCRHSLARLRLEAV